MSQWEYLEVTNEYELGFAPTKALNMNGKVILDWKKGPYYIEYFNQLGQKGWELVGNAGTRYYFKRMIS